MSWIRIITRMPDLDVVERGFQLGGRRDNQRFRISQVCGNALNDGGNEIGFLDDPTNGQTVRQAESNVAVLTQRVENVLDQTLRLPGEGQANAQAVRPR